MSYVKPSNNKLIDRTIRYVRVLLNQQGIEKSYEDVAYACFQIMDAIKPDEPIVLHLMKHFLR
jgi:N-acetylmuramic acid 6-phosphate etherase